MEFHRNVIEIKGASWPVVKVDPTTGAVYIRFSRKSVVSTQVLHEGARTVTVDLDAQKDVVGVEMIGVKEFRLNVSRHKP